MVISCAGSKHLSAGHMIQDRKKVKFVADPEEAQKKAVDRESIIYRHPDDPADSGLSWREELVKYNKDHALDNPLGLFPAWKLYKNSTYRELVYAFGNQNVFILSAGWGIISADFLTPAYDITFSKKVKEKYKKREGGKCYKDLSMLPEDTLKKVVFLGSQDYIPLFFHLTKNVVSEKIVFYNLKDKPDAPEDYQLRRFPGFALNWYYRCAKKLAQGNLNID